MVYQRKIVHTPDNGPDHQEFAWKDGGSLFFQLLQEIHDLVIHGLAAFDHKGDVYLTAQGRSNVWRHYQPALPGM